MSLRCSLGAATRGAEFPKLPKSFDFLRNYDSGETLFPLLKSRQVRQRIEGVPF
jgi:hypothetical protein